MVSININKFKIKPVIAQPFSFLLNPIAPDIIPNNKGINIINRLGIKIKLINKKVKDKIPQIGLLSL